MPEELELTMMLGIRHSSMYCKLEDLNLEATFDDNLQSRKLILEAASFVPLCAMYPTSKLRLG